MRHAAQHLSPWRTCDGMGLDPSSRPMPSRNPGLEELGSSIATTDSLRRRRQLEVPDTGEHRVYPVAPDRLAYSEPELRGDGVERAQIGHIRVAWRELAACTWHAHGIGVPCRIL